METNTSLCLGQENISSQCQDFVFKIEIKQYFILLGTCFVLVYIGNAWDKEIFQ